MLELIVRVGGLCLCSGSINAAATQTCLRHKGCISASCFPAINSDRATVAEQYRTPPQTANTPNFIRFAPNPNRVNLPTVVAVAAMSRT
ncbi:MAG TPA: hypothetical protein DDW76_19460 [Cyanobacteria bacterium UBA11369]|nr:hypothetical protein [Cyanobacteria bacterium UBA11371]HBE32809.1 hypothetical protein [Cyanobacteria bacterium UBA11368]HBE50889.1 hypothetical protein [Cyanobacteria bacterium UBA11369]